MNLKSKGGEGCGSYVGKDRRGERVDTSQALKSSSWFRFPYPLQWGTPVFHWKMAIVMCVVSLISSVDSVSFFTFSVLVPELYFILSLNMII